MTYLYLADTDPEKRLTPPVRGLDLPHCARPCQRLHLLPGRFAVQIRSRWTCHGMLAPNAKLRSMIIPGGPVKVDNAPDKQGVISI